MTKLLQSAVLRALLQVQGLELGLQHLQARLLQPALPAGSASGLGKEHLPKHAALRLSVHQGCVEQVSLEVGHKALNFLHLNLHSRLAMPLYLLRWLMASCCHVRCTCILQCLLSASCRPTAPLLAGRLAMRLSFLWLGIQVGFCVWTSAFTFS